MASYRAMVVVAVVAMAGLITPVTSRPQQTKPGRPKPHGPPHGHPHGHPPGPPQGHPHAAPQFVHVQAPIPQLPPVHVGQGPVHAQTANAFLQGFPGGPGATVVHQPPSIEILPNGQRVVQPVSLEVAPHGPQPVSYEILPDGRRVIAPISLEVGVHGGPGRVVGTPGAPAGHFPAHVQPAVFPGAPQPNFQGQSFQQQPNFQQVFPGAPAQGFPQGQQGHGGAATPSVDVRAAGKGKTTP